jgi:hypothetical protein
MVGAELAAAAAAAVVVALHRQLEGLRDVMEEVHRVGAALDLDLVEEVGVEVLRREHLQDLRLRILRKNGWTSYRVCIFHSPLTFDSRRVLDDRAPPPKLKASSRTTKSASHSTASSNKSTPVPAPPRSAPPRSVPLRSRPDQGNEEDVHCDCGVPAGERTVTKESVNKGRQFWTCETKACQFFQWKDDDGLPTSTPGANSSRMAMAPPSIVPSKRSYSGASASSSALDSWAAGGEDGVRRCKCGLTAAQKTVTKDGMNKGRLFWSCPNTSDKARCGFFEWDDEPPRTATGGGGGGTRGGDECYKVRCSFHADNLT